jgi:D-alanyl-D-alanine carboxypeptidase/D-alanyl-D-alanine-endopeptidase (penicillin-binding protein 4)
MLNRSQLNWRVLWGAIFASLFLVFVFAVSRPLNRKPAQKAAPARERKESETPAATPAKPAATISNSTAAAEELGLEIDRAIDESEFAAARWGVFVMSLRDGRVLYARDAGRAFTPASNMKLYTTAVALDLLGADYRWRTSVFAESEPGRNGTITGDLILYGRGAPDLASGTQKERQDSLAQLADDLYKRGVRRVRGSIVGDESYFRGEPLGYGWLWSDVQWYYGAEVSALSINGNEMSLTIMPAVKPGGQVEVKFDSPTSYLHITNDTNAVERGLTTTIGITRGLSDNEVRVWGDFPVGGRSFQARLAVHKPALWAATLFLDALKARGINVEGKARSLDAREPKNARSFNPENAVELASAKSQPLGEIARATNKESINLNAELILRTLGKERGGEAPDPNPRRNLTRGDEEAGLAVIRLWLERHNISTENLALHDGSGLSQLDLVTPEATVRLLAAMTNSASAAIFRNSLPIAGRDGTLGGRLRSIATAGRVAAKTGTLIYVNSLSGYTTSADGEPLAFSIICNDETEKASSTRVIDQIVALIASERGSKP